MIFFYELPLSDIKHKKQPKFRQINTKLFFGKSYGFFIQKEQKNLVLFCRCVN